ncbi:MAG: ABC transporter permease, partial [Kordiimonas sp.]
MIALNDLKYAVRLLSKRPGFTALTTLVMATGIGLSVYLLSFFNTVLVKDFEFRDSDTLYHISGSLNGARETNELLLHDLEEIRTNLKGIKEFSLYTQHSVNVAGRDGARRYSGVSAEANFFDLTRTKPVIGREFRASESQQGAEKVVIIGYEVWQNQYAGDTAALDQIMRINGDSYRIVGVMPEGYFFPAAAEIWLPIYEKANQVRRDDAGSYYALVHLDQDTTAED